MNDLDNFVKESKKDLKEILDCSGAILYSGTTRTLKPGQVYLLECNPGGSPKVHKGETIRSSLDNLPNKTTNSYLGTKWNSQLQGGVKRLFENLKIGNKKLDIEDVCASNLIFKRSKRIQDIDFEKYAEICWPVHDRILQIVKPKVIIAFGLGTYYYLKGTIGKNSEEFICNSGSKNRWGILYCKSFKFEHDSGVIMVVGLLHLSRFKIFQHVIKWIESGCKRNILDID